MKKRLVCLVANFLLLAAFAHAGTFSIADFGGRADGLADDGPALRKAFAYAASHPGTTLRLGGKCRVTTSVNRLGKPWPQMAAIGAGISTFTIQDGEIDLDGRFGAFEFENSTGVVLRNIVFDYVPPIFSQGSIVATDPAHCSMTVVPQPGYPAAAGEAFSNLENTWITVHKPGGEPAYFFVGHVRSSGTDSRGRTVLTYDRPDMARTIQGQKNLSYVRVQRGYGNMLSFKFCDRARLENCSIYSTSDFAGLFLFCNDVILTGNRICPRPGSGDIVSSCADGFHFIGAQRGPVIENNFFDRLEDDNIVISLRGNRIKSFHGNQLQLMTYSCTWYQPGDTIEVVTLGESMHRNYKIVSMPRQTNDWSPPVMTLDRPLEGKVVTYGEGSNVALPTLVFNRSWRLDGAIIRNNRFQNTRRYAVFMGAGGVRIENNIMSNFTAAAILCSHYDMLKGKAVGYTYYPYYFTSDLVVRNNVISGAFEYGGGGAKLTGHDIGAIDIYHTDRATCGIGNLHLAHDIAITGNTIRNSGGAGIHVANASNVTIAGNTIVNPNQLAPANHYGIWIESSPAVQANNNTVQGNAVDAPVHIDP